MKGQLYIGDDMVAETVEIVAPPHSGDLLIFEGKRLRIREVGHNVDRKKLQIMCHVPPVPAIEAITASDNPFDPDKETLEYAMRQVQCDSLDEYLKDEARNSAE